MKLLLTIDLPQQADWLLPKPWAAALLAALQQTLALEYPTPGTEPEQDQLPAWLRGCEVSLLLTDNPAIHRLNSSFRGVDRPTDVLSFPQYQAGEAVQPHSSLGDIVISLPKMAAQAAEFGHSQKRELCFLFVHGLLHLLGYDHELSAAEERRQFARQDEVLAALGVNR